jgi:HEAT repeat protein
MSAAEAASIEALVRSGDPGAGAAIRSAGRAAAPALAALATDPSPDVREAAALALETLAELAAREGAPAPDLEAPLARLLDDDQAILRRTAVRALARIATAPSERPLLAIALQAADPYERHAAARALGARALVPLDRLEAYHAAEADPWAARGWLLARARQGDPEAQRAYVGLLATDPDVSVHVTDHLPYLHGDWLAAGLLPLLDRREVTIFRGHGDKPETLRACDCAVIALVESAGLTLPFAVRPPSNWGDDALRAARALAHAAL